MYQLAAVFSPGFEKVIPTVLKDIIPDADKIDVSSGFVRFCVANKPFRAKNADFFNNSFLVLKEWGASTVRSGAISSRSGHAASNLGNVKNAGHNPSFEQMANKIKIPETFLSEILKQNYKSFRLRFSKENVFTSVNKQITANVEKQISMQTGMKPDRLGGDTEFWFLTRSDGYACFALRMTKKQSTEKYLEKGELRPEFVTLLAAFAGINRKSKQTSTPIDNGNSLTQAENPESLTILDPFAGHGGIVKRLAEIAPNAKIIASEIDTDLAKKLQNFATQNRLSVSKNKQYVTQSNSSRNLNVTAGSLVSHQADATKLNFIADKSIDVILTDPPWGFYVPASKPAGKGNGGDLRDDKKLRELYDGMLKEFYRVIKPNGTICVLTGAKEVFEAAFDKSEFVRGKTGNLIPTDGSTTSGKGIRNDVLVNGKKAAVYVFNNQHHL